MLEQNPSPAKSRSRQAANMGLRWGAVGGLLIVPYVGLYIGIPSLLSLFRPASSVPGGTLALFALIWTLLALISAIPHGIVAGIVGGITGSIYGKVVGNIAAQEPSPLSNNTRRWLLCANGLLGFAGMFSVLLALGPPSPTVATAFSSGAVNLGFGWGILLPAAITALFEMLAASRILRLFV